MGAPQLRPDFDARIAQSRRERLAKQRQKGIDAMQAANRLRVRALTPKQKHAIKLMSDFINNYSREFIADQVGVHPTKLAHWRHNPLFIRELDKAIAMRKTVMRPEAYRQLFKKLKKGSDKALALYLKMIGDLKDQVEFTDKTPIEDLDEKSIDDMINRMSNDLGITIGPDE